MDGIKNEVYRIKEAVQDGSTQECRNYIPIRLVTIIEQFFRVMIVDGRISKRTNASGSVSVSTLVDILEHFRGPQLSDDYGEIIDEDYGEAIRVFCREDNGCRYNEERVDVKFPKGPNMVIDELVSYVLGKSNAKASKWVGANTQSFQNVGVIRQYTGNFLDPPDMTKRYKQLFDTRHNLVHTLVDREFDIKHYFDLVERLFEVVERENPRHVQGSTGV